MTFRSKEEKYTIIHIYYHYLGWSQNVFQSSEMEQMSYSEANNKFRSP
jgi:hypothetical protein